jgi:hypothetical protein
MPPRRHIAWIACLAVLFNLLAMPLSSAAPKGPAEQLLWGRSVQHGQQAKVDVQALAKIDLGPQNDDSASMMNCWCCSGAAPLLALPATRHNCTTRRCCSPGWRTCRLPAHAAPAMACAQSPCLSAGLSSSLSA